MNALAHTTQPGHAHPRLRMALSARAAGTNGFVHKQHLFTHLRPAIQKLFPGPNRFDRCYEQQKTIWTR